MHFAPHLLRLLAVPGFQASVRFGKTVTGISDRKLLARTLHADVEALLGSEGIPEQGRLSL